MYYGDVVILLFLVLLGYGELCSSALVQLHAPLTQVSGNRAVYTLVLGDSGYARCTVPLLRQFAGRMNTSLVEFGSAQASAVQELVQAKVGVLDPPTTTGGAGDKRRVRRSTRNRQVLSMDAHFGKLLVFRDALLKGYDEVVYVDADIVPNRDAKVARNLFADAGLPADRPALALYGQGPPKRAVYDAVTRINSQVARLPAASLNYWNTGVMVVNRRGLFRLVRELESLRDAFRAEHGAKGFDSLPFFDQGFMNAFLWDPSLTNRSSFHVQPLSFRWNTSHSKYFFHHGNRFWLKEPGVSQADPLSFEPQLFHFMGCAGRKVDPKEGEQCKLKRIREFIQETYYYDCLK